MLPELRARFDVLEAQRHAYLDVVRPLSEVARARKPSADAWSLNELIHHLLLIDAGVLQDVRRAFERSPMSSGATAALRFGLLRRILALPVRIPAPPAAEGVMPRNTPDFAMLSAEWQRVRRELAALLDTATPERVQTAGFRHPIFGRFTLCDSLAFVEAHHAHHRPQLNRLLAAVADEEPIRT